MKEILINVSANQTQLLYIYKNNNTPQPSGNARFAQYLETNQCIPPHKQTKEEKVHNQII